MIYCSKCGKGLPDDAVFCSGCGTSVAHTDDHAKKKADSINKKNSRCPFCNAQIDSFSSICPYCKERIGRAEISNEIRSFVNDYQSASSEKEQIKLIKNFLIPNTREDIFEFMLFATSNFDADYYAQHLYVEDVSDAWLAKVEQCYQKSKFVLTKPQDTQKIENIYNKIISDVEKIKADEEEKISNTNRIEKKKRQFSRNKVILFNVAKIAVALIVLGALIFTVWLIVDKNCIPDENELKVGFPSSDLEDQQYTDVIGMFERSGFTDIEAREDGWNLFKKSGTVKSVTINGNDDFSSFSIFPKDAKVIIYYYK